ncbi:nickel pincer cofactor biosynthesis protein LarB [Chondromyces apiculatus]|uniref:Circadian phase modifier n=1 Tax=Chondromyces apiculatus DSM 436 TaxID=1192034 RepID=A0A017SYK3_9BACT|nr:nickel pincer cofactor biosynthesis protein LarB [Chondromyces apiculatus]EYF01700.1 Circadian phase modifier [Chondromyces apiculatus DSM 436]
MDPRDVRELLERVRTGELATDQALEVLQQLPFRDIGIATVDHHRALRQGVPEVIFGQGKSVDQIVAIIEEIVRVGQSVLVTRIEPDKGEAIAARVPSFQYAPLARTGKVTVKPPPERAVGPIAVVTAGTSDIPIAEEAAETLLAIGLRPDRIYDVGVAGLHRLLLRVDELRHAAAVIVIAGMEGALPSVVGGLVATPVIAVPTSIGYGAALSGFTALFSMLTSCASGVVVVNIDSGFGAAMAAHRMLPGSS